MESRHGSEHERKRQRVATSETLSMSDPETVPRGPSYEGESKGADRSRQDPAGHVKNGDRRGNIVTVLKIDWLVQSVEAGKALPWIPFLRPPPPRPKDRPQANDALQAPGPPRNFLPRRPKGPHGMQGPPHLLRQTTSEEENPPPPLPDWVRDQVLYACLRSTPLETPNEDFISTLLKIRHIRELTLDEIGVRAYSTSIAAVAAYPYKLSRPSEILALPGCDSKIANLFLEFQSNEGRGVAAADALEADPTLRTLNHFSQIWGVGAKTAREFFYRRGWRDLNDIVEHGWDTLSRVQQIGVKYYDELQIGIPRAEIESIARVVQAHANKVRPGIDGDIECILVGGYRRGKDPCGDVDLILSHPDEICTRNLIVDVVASLEKAQYITHTLSLHLTTTSRDQQTLPYRGEGAGHHFDTLDKALVVWQDPGRAGEAHGSRSMSSNPHRRVDIIISPWRTVGCAVLGWTGDKTFERDLRRYAKKAHGWKFDSSGIRDRVVNGQVLDLEHGGRTWEEREKLVMEKVGIGWRPPNERCTR
ncbi:hypothetical protein N7470_007223 [Penicillium chermesinum]|nr:hypothetical protein N7470_007223 [Penicillium chermesinum]